MNLFAASLAFVLALVLVLAGVTRIGVWRIERKHPPVGQFMEANGTRLHYVHVPAPAGADLPPIVFLHGASANLNDQMLPLRPLLEGRAEMLFLDRPGHGWSARGPKNETPREQAETVAALMDRLGIERAVIVGHSFGGAATAVFGMDFPERTLGLVFLAPATHPWPGGDTSWYYSVTSTPVLGPLFTETVTLPAGLLRMEAAAECVFAPNRAPQETYLDAAAIRLVLRPRAFRANARDVAGLFGFVSEASKRYPTIKAPTVVITGDRDTVVYEEIHSLGLARDIPGAELVWVENLGHKPDWVAADLVVAAIEKVWGRPRDLSALARNVEARIRDDEFGMDRCADLPAPAAGLQAG
ncbi:MAG TPA: alpha/beta hydrolase [Mesorhizobium sp.]|jgi:pimeloyl-ACP methyl ester carboxylesterase|nr:alpha/beta hydrolase [Mesorhizobium sp.]